MAKTYKLDPADVAPAMRHYTISAGASELSPRPRGIYVKAAGDATMEDDNAVSIAYTGLTAGMILPFSPLKVTSATATLIAWY